MRDWGRLKRLMHIGKQKKQNTALLRLRYVIVASTSNLPRKPWATSHSWAELRPIPAAVSAAKLQFHSITSGCVYSFFLSLSVHIYPKIANGEAGDPFLNSLIIAPPICFVRVHSFPFPSLLFPLFLPMPFATHTTKIPKNSVQEQHPTPNLR